MQAARHIPFPQQKHFPKPRNRSTQNLPPIPNPPKEERNVWNNVAIIVETHTSKSNIDTEAKQTPLTHQPFLLKSPAEPQEQNIDWSSLTIYGNSTQFTALSWLTLSQNMFIY